MPSFLPRFFHYPVLAVPVIDLMGGQIVHARRGERASYQPIQSPLATSSDPIAIVRGLMSLAPFATLYCADLDAIQRRGEHRAVLAEIARAFPALTIWIDGGFSDREAIAPWLAMQVPRLIPVVGTESLARPSDLDPLLALAPDAVLSLDTRAGVPLGPPALFDEPARWPERVIVMTLDRVGSDQGPSFERLRALRSLAPSTKLIAAGGVRSVDDLEALEAIGVHAVLLASAIHSGTLDRATLGRFARA